MMAQQGGDPNDPNAQPQGGQGDVEPTGSPDDEVDPEEMQQQQEDSQISQSIDQQYQ
jgi:hypothetical protein